MQIANLSLLLLFHVEIGWNLKYSHFILQLQTNTTLRHKTQSFDFDDISTNSPPWPPVNNTLAQNYMEDDKETGSGEWVDKVMVNNKQDVNKTENNLWQTGNGNLSEAFYQKYLQESSKVYSEQSYNVFMGSHQFNIAASDDNIDELDAATSDSSEPDLLWQFNHSKIPSLTNGIGSKSMRYVSKVAKSPELR
jgi:kinesin family protein C2/C3